jgi:uncharacterized protein YndB with AHSA1/START domain
MAGTNKSSAGTIRITRIFAAPRPLVFAAWTQSEHLKQWSAPRGFTIPVSRGDLRTGGKWSACMVSPEGEKLWLAGGYREVIKNRKLVFTHAWKGGDEETLVTVRFEDHARGTRIIFTQSGFASAGSRDGHKVGWGQCFDRLATQLQGQSARKS